MCSIFHLPYIKRRAGSVGRPGSVISEARMNREAQDYPAVPSIYSSARPELDWSPDCRVCSAKSLSGVDCAF